MAQTHNLTSAATTNATLVQKGSIELSSVTLAVTASTGYLKVFDLDHVPNPATDIPILVVGGAAGTFHHGFVKPVHFQKGLAIAMVTTAPDTGNTGVAAGQLKSTLVFT